MTTLIIGFEYKSILVIIPYERFPNNFSKPQVPLPWREGIKGRGAAS
jgi:hypothetical protein